MLLRSFLCFGLLLTGASCVPHAMARLPENADVRATSNADDRRPETDNMPPPAVIAAVIAPGKPATPFDAAAQSTADRRSSLSCLTAAVYYEARSESEDGQRAVAQVVLNRVRHPAFPRSVCGVVYQGSKRVTGCQFSFTCDGSLRRSLEPAAWARAAQIAEAALGGSVYAPVGMATHYHTNTIRPWWAASLKRAVAVGSHIFYRWRGDWGDPRAFRRPYSGHEPGASGSVSDVALLDRGDTSTILGVKVHRGSAGPAATSVAGVRIHRSSGPLGIAVHSGLPPVQLAAQENPPVDEAGPAPAR